MFRKIRLLIPLLLALLAACNQAPSPEAGTPIELTPMFGTSGDDLAARLASHTLGVYIVGHTSGNLHDTHKGERDVFVRKEDEYGRLLWGRQFGTSSLESADGVATDASNNAYVVGRTYGSLAGTYQGNGDVYIRKYDSAGGHVWTQQTGTSGYDFINSIAVYGDGFYVVGSMRNSAFVSKYSTSGRRLWTRHSGTTNPGTFFDVALDQNGNVYVAGYVNRSSTNKDMLIRKLTPSGGILWTRQFNYSNQEYGAAVAVSGNNVYLVGSYQHNNDGYDYNVAVIRFTPDGGQVWRRTYGAHGQDLISDASADRNGDLYFSGSTATSFAGPNQGGTDAYVVKVSYSGAPLWSKTIATSSADYGTAVQVRTLATKTCMVGYSHYCTQIYAAGYTYGSLPYVGNQGPRDAYLRRLYSGDGGTVWTK